MQKILFVCLGNICRSPLAEGIAKNYSEHQALNYEIDSCGTSNFHEGEAPCDNSVKIANKHSIDISMQRSRPIQKKDFHYYDKIIALDESNLEDLISMGAPKKKLHKLGAYGYNNQDVPDPYFFKGFEGFEKVFEMIENSVIQLLNETQQHATGK
ncbi:MAG: low molecular weight phosphotyrosine protein phosphatase [Campylobacterales bacterium]|nr:low molecular weight phosphotyrosine protein phosphatase [Campylobacterales bacterium]